MEGADGGRRGENEDKTPRPFAAARAKAYRPGGPKRACAVAASIPASSHTPQSPIQYVKNPYIS